MAMERRLLKSRTIPGMGYDSDTQTLEIELNGHSYTFNNVPPDVAEGLAEAGSAGSYFHTHIKGKY